MTLTRYLAALAAAASLFFMLGGLHGAEAGEGDHRQARRPTAFGDCTGYVAGVEDKLSPRCCRGLADIKDMAPTFDRRRALCACIHKEMGAGAGTADNDCAVAQTAFGDCTGYVAGVEDKLSPRCCRGLADIKDMAPTFDRRRALCACIHKEMVAAGKVLTRRAATLPARCSVRISFLPTAHDFDCYRIPRAD
ncbi:putative non-specific lipid-transfer protein 2 [Triticum urartu]|uniref:Putative non-specific lipid-transfer protein 2 n=1 Tax=Triticum urartu TaxID=4572 RepID=M7YRS9_TRIUA|nr:putative non-specific lipid-transfer protein 2 [Triticum urartu]